MHGSSSGDAVQAKARDPASSESQAVASQAADYRNHCRSAAFSLREGMCAPPRNERPPHGHGHGVGECGSRSEAAEQFLLHIPITHTTAGRCFKIWIWMRV